MTEHIAAQPASPEQQNQTPPVKRPKSFWRKLLCGLSAVIFLSILAFFITLSTSAGQRWLIELVDKALPQLSIAQVNGGLQEGLVLNQVRFDAEGVQTQLEQVRLQLDLSCLWRLHICVKEIALHQPHIQVNSALLPQKAKEKPTNTPMQRIHLPISVDVDKLVVEQLRLVIDDNAVDLAHFQTAASLNNESGLTIAPTTIQALLVKVVPPTVAVKEPSQTEKAPMDWVQIEKQLSAPLLAKLENIVLPFDMHIQHIQGQDWQYQQVNDQHTQVIDIPVFQLQANATGAQIELSQFNVQSNLANLQGSGHLQLDADFPLHVALHAEMHTLNEGEAILLPASQVDVTLSGNLKKQTALTLQSRGALHADLNGQFALSQEKTPFQIKLSSQDFRYPFQPAQPALVHIPQLNLQVSGDLLDYQLQLNTEAEGANIPKTALQFDAKGELLSLDITQLHLDTLKGSADLQGKIGWQNGVQWYSNLQLDKLNLSDYLAGLPTILSGQLFSTGLINQQQWLFDIPHLNLEGTLSQRPLALKGSLSVGSETWLHQLLLKVPDLVLTYGENKIVATGFLGEKSDLKLDINAPDLRGLMPNLSANLQGHLQLNGQLVQPTVALDLVGHQIKFNDLNINKVTLKGHVDMAKQTAGELALQVNKFQSGEVKLDTLDLTLHGNEAQHNLTLVSQGEPVAPKLSLEGQFDRATQRWQGALKQVSIASVIGHWHTDKNVVLAYDNPTMQTEISAHCWQNNNMELCFPQAFRVGKNGEVPFKITKFDLALVNDLLEQDLLQGQLQSEGKIAWFSDKPLQLNVQVKGDNLSFTQKIDYRTFGLDVPKLTLNADLQNNHLVVNSNVLLQDQGNVSANLEVKDLTQARQLGGSLIIHQLNLDIFNQLLSNNEVITGDIVANLKFAGTLNAPNLNGQFKLARLNAKMKSLPFDIEGGELALNFAGNRSTLNGHIKTPDSRLNLEGDASWQNLDNWTSRLHAKADQFKVDIPAMAKLKISPNVEITASPKRLQLTGNIDIPWARIEIESLPESAVSVSPDEVILDNQTTQKVTAKLPSKTKSGMEILSDLKINIGQDVYLNAYGLKTNLNGLLSVRQEKGNLGLFGQIHLTNGRYASFGQDLLIRKGMISFSGQPSQPMLNIEAIRNPESMDTAGVVAGIKVLGLAESPEIKVFSEPGMSQDQALSYVLTGRSLENSGEAGSGGSIGAALLGLGLAKSGKAVGGIGQAFGIQDLNLGTQGVGDSSKVVVSGNITPRLQVKYGVGLFDGLAEFTVRYRLIPKLYLQSVSGVTQAVDLLYQFEF
ncbi:autotransporter assembly complex protein TamB [Pasteurella multocida]|uniref:autotransporter assembly complex protein TamB n=1 Tax=Pasteurella multocida TaxID=747 RepID=UPI00202201DC|nr:translocation/assembly module TamB domain-containing protein [Pasteurella multocida]MCL7817376.1 translocation/assembly module TamB [Pasteurella multocida]MEB3457512.1 translocation/assembly module TamB domain-containing protein [Pasteurella multocida]MEB3488734.1 translocation/assembly module TamB domain-containing protein [Pasteurella multocida]MEB3490194.1 translocation/assembly module TamB domain-containing protein [Pasteurella multocida]HDR0612426.1 translocation/assembly module TamB [